jgi:hypothetical protein
MFHRILLRAVVGASLGLLACAGSAMAGGGVVQPASSTPLGYSLSTLAQDTAAYNVAASQGITPVPAVPNIPFNVLEGNTSVSNSSYLYLPVFFADNSLPFSDALSATFPASVANQATDAAWLDNYVLQEYGVSSFLVQVDGVNTTLSDSYIVGVSTGTLPDGAYRSTDAGPDYITDAAVLSPLSYGTHTIGFGGYINGNPVIFGSDTVTSVPEPASMGLLGLAGAALMRRRKRR